MAKCCEGMFLASASCWAQAGFHLMPLAAGLRWPSSRICPFSLISLPRRQVGLSKKWGIPQNELLNRKMGIVQWMRYPIFWQECNCVLLCIFGAPPFPCHPSSSFFSSVSRFMMYQARLSWRDCGGRSSWIPPKKSFRTLGRQKKNDKSVWFATFISDKSSIGKESHCFVPDSWSFIAIDTLGISSTKWQLFDGDQSAISGWFSGSAMQPKWPDP